MTMLNVAMVIGLIKSLVPKIDPADIESAVADWLDDHPEATTTVEDGSITEEKLASDVLLTLSTLESDVSDVKNEIDGIIPLEPKDILAAQIERNLFNPYTTTLGYMIDKTTGELVESANNTVSDFIEVEAGTVYAGNPGRFAWYTEDKTFISGGESSGGVFSETAPANAKYLRADRTTSYIQSFAIYKYVFRGAVDYMPYKVKFPYLTVTPDIKAEDFDKFGATFVNIFNKHTAVDGSYVNHDTGNFSSNNSYFRSYYIPVKPSTTYKMTYGNRYAVYDKDYKYITGENKSGNPATFTTPNNAAYVIICGTPISRKDTMVLAEASIFPDGYESYGVVVPWIKPSVAKSKYDGKTLVCFGDSITFSDYTGTIAADTGMTVINQGYSSARWAHADDASSTVNAFAMHELIKALTTDDWTTPDTIIGVSGYEEQAAQLAILKQINFSNVDFVSFACGTNDFSSATPLDNPSDPYDTEYVKGAIRYCIKTLLTAYPHLKIICATPCYRFWIESNEIVDDCDTHQIGGMLLKDVCEAIEEASTDCHIQYVNNLKNAGMNEFNRLQYFNSTDGLHPNIKGRAILGHRIGAAILEQL